jgi:hypothetical protein
VLELHVRGCADSRKRLDSVEHEPRGCAHSPRSIRRKDLDHLQQKIALTSRWKPRGSATVIPGIRASMTALAAGLVALFLVAHPWYMPATGIDPSWWMALEYSYRNGLVLGRDFSFAAGPLSFVYTRLFHPATFPWVIAAIVHAVAVYSALICCSPHAKLSLALLIWLALLLTNLNPDTLCLSLVLAVALLSMRRMAPAFLTGFLIVGLALSSLAKFSILAFCLPLLLLVDLLAALERRTDFWHTALYCVSIVICYRISGQPLDGLFEFLAGSIEVAAGYSQTMANFSWGQEQTILVLLSCGLLATAVVISKRAFSIVSLFCLLALGWYLFFSFKLGNVRVGHQFVTWHALATGGLLLILFPVEDSRQLRQSALIAAVWILVGASPQLVALGVDSSSPARTPISAVSEFAQDLTGWLSPRAKLRGLAQQRDSRDAQLAQRVSGDLSGTVGSVPWEFAELIAAGTRFVPSPSLQTYANYTPRLRARTTRFFESEARPKNLFFQLSSIDGRYRTLELGPALIPILAGYDAVLEHSQLFGAPLQLLSRAQRRSVETRVIAIGFGRMGAWVDMPSPSSGSLLLAIRPRETLAGKILTALYKQERLSIDLRFASGAILSALAFPSLTADGFLVLPSEATELELFRAASDGLTIEPPDPLTAFRIRPVALGSLRFAADYQFEASAVTMSGAPEHPLVQPPLPHDPMQALIRGRIIESPEVRVVGGKLLAHPPSRIVAPMPAGKALAGEIGFFDDAWRRGEPRPVTFSISIIKPGGNEVLFQRTLDPAKRPEDRGPQRFSIDLRGNSSGNPIELQFDTYPGTSWGWTYWSNLHLED